MEKRISRVEFATIKRVAQCVSPMLQKRDKLDKQIKKMSEERDSLNLQIEGFEQGIKALCGGLTSEDIVHRESVVLEDKFDKDGRPVKKVTFEPNPCVRVEDGAYYLTIPEQENQAQGVYPDHYDNMEKYPEEQSEEQEALEVQESTDSVLE